MITTYMNNSQLMEAREEVHSDGPGLTVAVIVVFWAFIVLCAVGYSETWYRTLMISGIATAILAPIAYRAASGTVSLFEPIIPSALAMLVMYVGRPIADQALGSYLHLGYDISRTFDWVLFVIFIGVVAFMIGYHFGGGDTLLRRWMPPPDTFPETKLFFAAAIIALIGAALFGTFVLSNGGVGSFLIIFGGRSFKRASMLRQGSAYLYFGIYLLLPATIVFYGLWERTRNLKYVVCSVITGVPLFLYEASLGDRSELLPLVLGLPTVHYLWRAKRPRLFRMIAAGLILLVFFAFLRTFRNATATGHRDIKSTKIYTDPGMALASTFTKDDSEMFDTFCNLVTAVPSKLPYQPLGLVRDIGIRLLPRVIYPEKPLELPDQVIVVLWPAHYRSSRASSASSILANFYQWGGVFAVCIAAFGMGILMRSLWRWYMAFSNNLHAILLYSFVPALVVILWRGTVTDTLGRMFFTVLPMILLQRHLRLSRGI